MRRSIKLTALALAASMALAACGDDGDGGADTTAAAAETTAAAGGETTAAAGGGGEAFLDGVSLTVGSADFSESVLLAEIYAQALEAKGADVSRKLQIGSREVYFAALENGETQLQPEYTNSLLSFVLKESGETPTATSIDEQVAALKESLPESLTVLSASTAEDKDSVVCNGEAASELGLATLSDLEAKAGEVVFAAPPEFADRQTFGEGLTSDKFKEFKPLAYGVPIADAIEARAVDCGNLFSTDPLAGREGFVGLEDDKGVVPPEAVLPLIAADLASPDVAAALDAVSAQLDTDGLKALMVRVGTDAEDPAAVAGDWLAEKGLA